MDCSKRQFPQLYSLPITADDMRIYDISAYDSKGQQLWECLAMLVALRLWLPECLKQRLDFSVRGDNIGAITLLLKMRPKDANHAIVGRELALVLIQAPFFPEVAHTLGIAHVVADALSRMFDPSVPVIPPHFSLSSSVAKDFHARDESYYKCLKLMSSGAYWRLLGHSGFLF